jgi:hypothetical protein
MKGMKKVEVKWLDAADDKDVAFTSITNSRKHLVERTSTGWLKIEDEQGVVLIKDIDEEDDCEIVAIPKAMLVSLK